LKVFYEIEGGRFTNAEALLRPMINDDNVELASKAAYNLSVVYEAQGNNTAAKDMAELSLKKKYNKYAEKQLAMLTQ
jgi:hypothetical protein